MLFSIFADIIVIAHFLFVLFVIFGGFLVLHKKGWAWLHIPAAFWGAFIELADWVCPLTPLENMFRLQSGGTAYASDFVEYYIIPLLYPSFLTKHLQLILGLFVIVINICIYGWIIWRRKSINKPEL
jgi:hypothetical protein